MDKSEELKASGNAAFQAGRFEEAISLFSEAIALNPKNHILFSNRSGAYVSIDKFEEAFQDAHMSITIKPDYVKGYKRKGLALYKLGKYKDAVEAYQAGLKLDPANAEIKADLQQAEKMLGAGPQQNQFANQILMKLLTNPKTRHLIQKPDFMQKLQMVMSNPALLMTLSQTDPDVKLVMEAMMDNFNPKDFNFGDDSPMAEEEAPAYTPPPEPKYEPRYEPKPQPPKPSKTYAPGEQYKEKGNAQFKAMNFEKAIQLYNKAIEENPQEVLFINNKVAAQIELGRLEEALTTVQTAIKLIQEGKVKNYEKKAKVFARKGSVLSKLYRLEESLVWYEKSLLQNRDKKVEDDYKGVQKLKKQIDEKNYINPEIGQQVNEEGNVLFKEGKFPDALKKYEDAIRRNPSSPKFLANKGMCYIKLMEFARARDEFEKALNLDANYVRALTKKGDCHFFLKQYHKAQEMYERGLSLQPENQGCKEGLLKAKTAMYSSSTQKDQEERARHAMADPEIQAILMEPEIRNILAELQENPAAASKALRDPKIAAKINKLIASGVLRTG